MQLKERPFWLDTTPAFTTSTAPPPCDVDVAVVGAGYTGIAAARTLAQRGAAVVALEAQTFGAGASARNGGMALTGLKLDVATLIEKYGLDAAQQMFAASLAALDYVEQIVYSEGIACDFERSGHLVVASKPAHAAALAHEAELLAREFNHPTRLVPKQQLRDEIGSPRYHGGLVDELSAGINPARYLAGLTRAAQRAGARICYETPLQRLKRKGSVFHLQTPRGNVRARSVLIATGGYTGAETPKLRRKIVPLGSYCIATTPLSDALAREIIPHNRMIFDTRNLLHYYRLTPDNRLLFGGRARFVPATNKTVRESVDILRQAMTRVYPQLRNTPVEYAWGGILDVTFDLMPHTGKIGDLHFAAGYAGHGVALATYLGSKVAERILGASSNEPFEALPFPGAPLGLYGGALRALPLVGAWYQLLDVLK
jgi:glycine/D-amino acid oxidase-like deaminating enzyme